MLFCCFSNCLLNVSHVEDDADTSADCPLSESFVRDLGARPMSD